MAEWSVQTVSVPSEITNAARNVGTAARAASTFLQATADVMDVLSSVSQAGFDGYSSLVNTVVDLIQDVLTDFENTGVHVLVDYPQNLKVPDFNPVSRVQLAGTVLDHRLLYDYKQSTSDDDPSKEGGENSLQAISNYHTNWNPASKDVISFEQAIQRVAGAFSDPEDSNRPVFTTAAKTAGVVLMVHSQSVPAFMQLVKTITSLFAVDGLEQLQWPAFEELFPALGKPFSDLTDEELSLLDISPVVSLRDGGKHPNFIYKVTLGELIPVLGTTMGSLRGLLELLLPDGGTSKLIQSTIDAFTRKIKRIDDLANALADLADTLEAISSADAFATLVVTSTTGNAGFIDGMLSATGHPEFERDLVCTLLLYAGGSSADVLTSFFVGGEEGGGILDSVPKSIKKSIEDADSRIDDIVNPPS